MKSVFLMIGVLSLGLMSCGRTCHDNVVQVPGPMQTVTVTTPAPTPDPIQSLVNEENSYRLSQGQTMLSQGLSCTVQLVSSGQWLSSASPGYNAGQGVVVTTGTSYGFLNQWGFNQPDATGDQVNNIIPRAIQPLFVGQNYKITCNGYIVVEQDGYHEFDVSSDDGAILTVDGTQVLNNDGNHAITNKAGTKLLRQGVRSFNLSYAQTGSGNFALIVNMDRYLASGVLFFH